ncbi:MAG: AraC family transcriptional regulator [Thermoclostridium sp.]|nr:AraC family transcriptional regulator [Thermoclostridium sp.]
MLEKYYFSPSDPSDLNVYRCGIETCKPGYTWGPGIRDHFIVHCVLEGSGTFTDGSSEWKLKQGDGFVVFPDKLVTYTADKDEPWTYSWVGFHGLKAETFLTKAGLCRETPVFFHRTDKRLVTCLENMISDARLDTPSELMLLGHLYIFLSLLIGNNRSATPSISKTGNSEKHCKRAIEFISRNYSNNISIQDIASDMNLNRSYLYTIFMKTLNMSPQDFLIHYRLERAIELMGNSELNNGDISRSVGYEDPLQFSRIFKKKKGVSPSAFRQNSVGG